MNWWQEMQQTKPLSTKDIMLRSLEKLGASIEEFLDRQVLLQESQKFIQKGIPTALSWFPFNTIPFNTMSIVHWSDTNQGVEPDILKGLLVQSFKQKTIEPNPTFCSTRAGMICRRSRLKGQGLIQIGRRKVT